MAANLTLDTYRLLGRSGLRVSPLALGTMTFGETWGADEVESQRMFDLYVDRGGNFIDTAGYYAQGVAETLTGKFAISKRERLVLSTKYSMSVGAGNPNAGGNGRRSMVHSVEHSLKRLKTDYIDLLFLHIWDDITPADEILRAFDDLIAQGKILYIGISDTPAWCVTRLQTIAELRGWTRFAAMQVEYNLVKRTPERELLPMAAALGIGAMPWSPLAGGMLSGKYTSEALKAAEPDGGRGQILLARGMVDDRVLSIANAVRVVADQTGYTSAQVALAWTMEHPSVVSPIIGVRTLRQLEDNLGSLGLVLSTEQVAMLDAPSRIELGFPHDFLKSDFIQAALSGSTTVQRR